MPRRIADSDGAEYIFHETEGRFPRLHTVLVDQGYKSWLVEFAKRWFGIIVDIVQRPPAQREFVVQPQRWKIERTFGWLDWSRILSKEYERTTESSESDIYLASIRLMLRRLASSPNVRYFIYTASIEHFALPRFENQIVASSFVRYTVEQQKEGVMKRAINLARVSTPQQAKLYSLDFQIDQMRGYDAGAGLQVVAEFKDDTSGRKLERDGLEQACQMLENDEADVLVTWKFDRLHRNYVNSVILRDRIRRAGKEIHFAQSRTISGKTARERLPEDLQFIMSEVDADTIAENTYGGKVRKAQAHKWLGLNRPPFGYRKEGQGKTAVMVVDEEAAEIVDGIFTWYVVGFDEVGGRSTQDIADRLTALGIATPADRIPYYSKAINKHPGFWSRDTVTNILRTKAYSGTYYQTFNQTEEKTVPMPVPQLVDTDIFTAAQRKLDEGRAMANRGTRFDYLVGRRIRVAVAMLCAQ